MRNWKSSLLASLIVGLLLAAPAWAQDTAGSVSGTVTDPDGAPLPGVAVTVESPLIPSSTVYTQSNGAFRFPALPPGEGYSLTFQLEGFKTVVQEDLGVRVSGNTQVNVSMELSSVEETVTVTGTAPIVDVKKTSIGRNVTEQYMQSIPSARDPWVMLEQTAGVQIDRQNIGGSESGQQSGFTANGANRSDSVWTYDGAEVTDMAALGASPMYYDFDAFEEISISTGGNDPSVQTGGIHINFVTKRGGNSWRAAGRLYVTSGDLQADNVGDPKTGKLVGDFTQDELFPGYIGNSINNIKDYGGELGGPVLRDRFFIWGAYGFQNIQQRVGLSPDNTQLQNWHAKGTYHLGDKMVLNYTFVRANKTKQGRGAAANRPPDTTFDQEGPSPIHTGKVQYTIDDNNYIEGTFNYTGLGFSLTPQGGVDNQVQFDLGTGQWAQSFYFLDTKRPLYNVKVDGNSYIGGSSIDHELKYGYSYRDAEVTSAWGPGGGAVAIFVNGAAAEAWLINPALDHYRGRRNSVYAGDTISAGRVTINAGLRYDHQTSVSLASATPASVIAPDVFPAQSFNGFDPGFAWNNVSPRFGLTYDLTGDSTTILKVTAARYYAQMSSGELHRKNTTFGPEIDLQWNDVNGNGQIDPGEAFGDPLFISPGFDPNNPNAPNPNVINKTDAPWSNEIIVGIEHELNRSFSVGFNFIYRKNGNFTWAPRAGENDPSFWTPVTQNVPGFGDLTVYQPVGPRAGFTVYQQRPGFDTQYRGVELLLTKRFSNRWMANASFTVSDTEQNFSTGGFTDPTNVARLDGQQVAIQSGGSGRSGTFFGASRWYLKGSGMYQFPGGVSIAGFFQAREGNINPQFVRSNNRAFGASRVNAFIEDFGDTRLPTYWDVDLRGEKTIDLQGHGRLHLIVDAFNVFNRDIVLARHNQVNSSNHNKIREVVEGRTVRFGVRLVLR